MSGPILLQINPFRLMRYEHEEFAKLIESKEIWTPNSILLAFCAAQDKALSKHVNELEGAKKILEVAKAIEERERTGKRLLNVRG